MGYRSPLDLALRRKRPTGSSRVSQAGRNAKILPGSSHGLRSTPGYDSNRTASREASPLMGSIAPTAHKVTGSDQHREYQTRLCSAFGFSQPLDALLLPKPLRPCFMPVTLMGFALQRLPLLTSRQRLSTPPSPLDVVVGESFAAWRTRHLLRRVSDTRPSYETLHPSPTRDLLRPATTARFRRGSRPSRSAADGSDVPSGVYT
jgi:hypothetical protein